MKGVVIVVVLGARDELLQCFLTILGEGKVLDKSNFLLRLERRINQEGSKREEARKEAMTGIHGKLRQQWDLRCRDIRTL